MNGELKSKFRDRLKFFKKLFFLKKKNGSNYKIENINDYNSKNNNIDKKIIYNKKNTFVNYNFNKDYRTTLKRLKKRSIGIDNSSDNLKLNNIKDNEFKESIINVNKRIVSSRYFKNGIDEVYKDNFDDFKLNLKYINKKNYDIKSNNNFDKVNYIEKNDRELLLNVIVGKLENKSKKMLFKLDNLYSDYYNILNYSEEEIERRDCEKKLKEIEKIRKDIEDITKQFNIIKGDKYLDNILELDDSNLVDDIIKYKNICNKLKEKKEVYEKYKKIDEFVILNTYLEKFNNKIDNLKSLKENKKEEIEKRDKEFDSFKSNVNFLDIKNERYFSILNSQVDITNNILKNVEDIFKSESVSYRLKGFGELVSSSFKYLFYLSVSPFNGLFPSIAINTLATKHMIKNLRNNLEMEEIRKVSYFAKDYENEINRCIYDVNKLNDLLYSTLDDIGSLKAEFIDKYKKNIDKIPEYNDILKKIEKQENIVKFNLNRVNKVEESLNKSKEKNKNKLIKIKYLNNKNN